MMKKRDEEVEEEGKVYTSNFYVKVTQSEKMMHGSRPEKKKRSDVFFPSPLPSTRLLFFSFHQNPSIVIPQTIYNGNGDANLVWEFEYFDKNENFKSPPFIFIIIWFKCLSFLGKEVITTVEKNDQV